ncbi:MAG: hypothetical protein BEN18_10445 [Epulopiscium sp. Nuni2H_MBin001]|nr:MAG: hypothetical protein BEN18_10445 [Epulopiscium sp. Nuni2H_MBin001]
MKRIILAVFIVVITSAVYVTYIKTPYQSPVYILTDSPSVKYALDVYQTQYPSEQNTFYHVTVTEDDDLEELLEPVIPFATELYVRAVNCDIEEIKATLELLDVEYYIEIGGIVYGKENQGISFEIYTLNDIEALHRIDSNTTIYIRDNIVNCIADVDLAVDLISRLYYDIATQMPNVVWINQDNFVDGGDYRILDMYDEVISKTTLINGSGNDGLAYELTDSKITYEVDNQLDIVIVDENPIEYVYYLLNGYEMGVNYRYPYVFNLSNEDIVFGNNELKIGIKFARSDEIHEQYVYFTTDYSIEKDRAARVGESYSIQEQPIYTKPYIPVLMYHDFADVVGPTKAEQSITVSTSLFEQHIIQLLENGYTPINFKDLWEYLNNEGGLPDKPVIITADDGYLSNYEIAYPILQKYNVPATYFICTGYVDDNRYMPHFSWDDAIEMEASGLIDIQSHTHTHPLMNKVDEAKLLYEVNYSIELIEKHLGKRDVVVLSYPQFGHNSFTVRTLSNLVDIQVTDLNKWRSATTALDVKRIHVSNDMSDVIKEIERLTQ